MEPCPICQDPSTKTLGCNSHAVCDDCYKGLKQMAQWVHVDGISVLLDEDMPTVCPLCRAQEPVTNDLVTHIKNRWARSQIKISFLESDITTLQDLVNLTNEELEDAKETAKQFDEDITQMEDDLKRLSAEYHKVSDENIDLEDRCEELRAENETLRMGMEDVNYFKRPTNKRKRYTPKKIEP